MRVIANEVKPENVELGDIYWDLDEDEKYILTGDYFFKDSLDTICGHSVSADEGLIIRLTAVAL